jgi:hypothetical protein
MLSTLALGVLGAATFLAWAPAAAGQAAAVSAGPSEPEFQPVPNTTPLAITVTPAPVAKGQVPEFVTMTLTNTSDHAVRFPQPGIGCTDAANGTIELVVTPAGEAESCMTTAPVATPVEKWMTLEPGETANFGERVTPLLPKGAGTVEVRAVYTPPLLAGAKQEELYRESVTYPVEALTSEAVALVREP